jgi:formylglycine-generating enzyme required for sulfatase activity
MLKVAPDLQQLTVMKVAGPSTPVGNVEVGRKMPAVVGPLSVITNEIGMKLVLIPAGEFLMGSKRGLLNRIRGVGRDESPPHRVRITKPFYLGVTPVTQAEYQQVMGTNPSYFSAHGGEKEKVAGMDTSRFPVENVSWEEAVEFCRRLSQQEGKQYGLPTEAEWEYACRAGSRMRYCFGDDKRELGEYAWFDANSRAMVQPVGQKKPNAWGLYDMHGHICEWCADRYDERYYANSPTDDPTGPTTGSHRALRGSCWFDSASECHSANRSLRSPEDRHSYLGFRVARVIAE